MARLWDDLVRVPGLDRRLGLDAIVGFIPGVGDVIGALVASWGIVVGVRLRAPGSVLLHMMLNIGIDAVGGAIPFLGDLFDMSWRAQRRNVALLERWLEAPTQTARASVTTLIGVAVGMISVVVGTVWLAVRTVAWMLTLL